MISHRIKLPCFVGVFLAITQLVTCSFAQYGDNSSQLTINCSFETTANVGTLDGWNYRQGLNPTILDRPARNPDAPSSFEIFYGNKYIKLTGTGGFGQMVSVKPSQRNLMFNIMGYSRRVSGTAPTNVLAQVTLYDSSWKELSITKIPIGAKVNNGYAGLAPYTYGINAPVGTAFALMAVWNWDAGVETYVDAFAIYDYTPSSIVGSTLIVNNTPGYSDSYAGIRLWGEFWNTTVDYSVHPTGITQWGSPNKTESAYQEVPLVGNKAYRLTVQNTLPSSIVFGADHYDQSWQAIGKTTLPPPQLPGRVPTEFIIAPPAATKYSSLYFYVPQGATAQVPNVGLYEIGDLTNGELIQFQIFGGYGAGPRYSETYGWRIQMVWVDTAGVDVSSITTDDFYVSSKSTPGKTYPITFRSVYYLPGDGSTSSDLTTTADGKSTRVNIEVFATTPQDFGTLVLKPNAIKDKNGNFVATRSFPIPAPPASN